MSQDASLWGKIMKAALAIPGVAIDRESYLRTTLKDILDDSQMQLAIETRPAVVMKRKDIDKLASSAITYHTATVTTLSTVTGLPGGPAIVASIPADLAQYYFHVFVLAQKMAYLYGFPDLRDENAKLTEDAADMLTLFVGIMMGARLANNIMRDIATDLAVQVAKKIPQKTLTRTIYYPIVHQVSKRIGTNISKSGFTKTFGRFIPLLGGIVSGGITYATFYPGAKRLQKALHQQMDLLGDNLDAGKDISITDGDIDESLERNAMQTLVNMALMNESNPHKKHEYLSKAVSHTSMDANEKESLISAFDNQDTFKVDLQPFSNDEVSATLLMRRLAEIIHISDNVSVTEKIYLNKISRELGYSQRDVEQFIEG